MTRYCAPLLLLIRILITICLGTGALQLIARASTTTPAFAPPRPALARSADARGNVAVESDAVDGDEGKCVPRYAPPLPLWSIRAMGDSSSPQRSRFQQHANPLSRKCQMSADLPVDWPRPDFDDADLPLDLDIGRGKGGSSWIWSVDATASATGPTLAPSRSSGTTVT